MMTHTDDTGSAEARALSVLREESGSAPSGIHDADVMRRALEAYERRHGAQATLELAADLLFREFEVLAWQPPIGAALARWAIPHAKIPALLLHAIAQYLALYYPELEGALQEVQQHLASNEPGRAHLRLAAALDELVP